MGPRIHEYVAVGALLAARVRPTSHEWGHEYTNTWAVGALLAARVRPTSHEWGHEYTNAWAAVR